MKGWSNGEYLDSWLIQSSWTGEVNETEMKRHSRQVKDWRTFLQNLDAKHQSPTTSSLSSLESNEMESDITGILSRCSCLKILQYFCDPIDNTLHIRFI